VMSGSASIHPSRAGRYGNLPAQPSLEFDIEIGRAPAAGGGLRHQVNAQADAMVGCYSRFSVRPHLPALDVATCSKRHRANARA
jgi:hypothetical protein